MEEFPAFFSFPVLAQPEWVFLSALLGLCIGSFLNVVVHRLPRILAYRRGEAAGADHVGAPARMSLSWPPSHCPACQTRLRFWENIPLLSFLILRGRCRSCGAAISWRYPAMEALCALAFAALALALGPAAGASLVFAMALTATLLALAALDLEASILPDAIVVPLLWLGLLVNLQGRFVPLADAVIGAAAGYVSLWIVSRLYRLIRNRDGIRDGDLKLLATLGAWLGWRMVPPIVLIAAAIATVAAVIVVWSGRRNAAPALPFGAALAAAGWVCLAHVAGLV